MSFSTDDSFIFIHWNIPKILLNQKPAKEEMHFSFVEGTSSPTNKKYQGKQVQCAFVRLDWTRSYFHPIILSFTICLKLCRLWKATRCLDCFSSSFHKENCLPFFGYRNHSWMTYLLAKFFHRFIFSPAIFCPFRVYVQKLCCFLHQSLLQTWIVFT